MSTTTLDKAQIAKLADIARTTGPLGTDHRAAFDSLVLLTVDVDCDGTAYGAVRVTVPTEDWGRYACGQDRASLNRYLEASGQRGRYAADIADVRTLEGFLRDEGPHHDPEDLEAFCGAYVFDPFHWNEKTFDHEARYVRGLPYLDLGTTWQPWAGPNGDDTIGTVLYDTDDYAAAQIADAELAAHADFYGESI